MLYYISYSTVQYRLLNLMIVGSTESGKTSLMMRLGKLRRRLNLPKDEISIYDWKFSSTTSDKCSVYFRICDFPSQVCLAIVSNTVFFYIILQDNQTTAYYSFYSKQAIYLAVFKLTDGKNGIKGLSKYLQNIKVTNVRTCIQTLLFMNLKGTCPWMSSHDYWHPPRCCY